MGARGPKPGITRPPTACECGDHAWVTLTRGYVALIDVEDIGLVAPYSWSAKISETARGQPYVRAKTTSCGKTLVMHRLIMAAPAGLVDHRNGDALLNRKGNLRVTDHSGNSCNRRPHGAASGYKGIWKKHRGGLSKPWVAEITITGKDHFLGTFSTPEEAARAYDEAAIRLHGEFAWTNFRAPALKDT